MEQGFSKEDYEDVYATARMAHLGQERRSGAPGFSHPSAVRNLARKYYPNDKQAQLVALLHDTLEDAPKLGTVGSEEEMKLWIRGAFGDEQSAEKILATVEALTHPPGMRYDVYVSSLLGDELALRVKLVDMLHNLRTSPSPKQAQKYKNALEVLADLAGGKPIGISREHWAALQTALSAVTESRRRQIENSCKIQYDVV
jgi:GTP pyrophosphokinase|tara:strand:+ start:1368 stop:1967 length:600 start_codon:yes stop_codon:yes gene_type:complete